MPNPIRSVYGAGNASEDKDIMRVSGAAYASDMAAKKRAKAYEQKIVLESMLDPAEIDAYFNDMISQNPDLTLAEQTERRDNYVNELMGQHAALSTALAESEELLGVSQLPAVEPSAEDRMGILKDKLWKKTTFALKDIPAAVGEASDWAFGPPSKNPVTPTNIIARALRGINAVDKAATTAIAAGVDPEKQGEPLVQRVLAGASKGLEKGWAGEESFPGSWGETMIRTDQNIVKSAREQAFDEMVADPGRIPLLPNGDLDVPKVTEHLKFRIKQLAEEGREATVLPTQSPVLSELGLNLVASPWNLIAPGARAAAALPKAAKGINAIEKAIVLGPEKAMRKIGETAIGAKMGANAVADTIESLRWAPKMTGMKYGSDAAQDAAAVAERGFMEAEQAGLKGADAQAHVLGRLGESNSSFVIKTTHEGNQVRLVDQTTGIAYIDVMHDPFFKEATKVQELPLPEGLKGAELKAYKKKTKEQLKNVAEKQLWVPEDIAEQLKHLESVGLDMESAAKGFERWDSVMNATARPINSIWRKTNTLTFPAYYQKNFMTSVLMPVSQLGFKAADPRIQLPSALAAAGFGDGKAAKLFTRTLEDGSTMSYERASELLGNAGLSKQGMKKINIDEKFTGPLGTASEWIDKGLKKTGAQWLNNTVDNHQKIVTFMTVLQGSSPKDVALALQKTAKIAGDFRRLTPIERHFAQDAFSFYGWSRYAIPAMIQAIATRPEVAAKFEALRRSMEREYGKYAPVYPDAINPRYHNISFTAPLKSQPQQVQDAIAAGELDDQTELFAMGYVEDPNVAGLSALEGLGYDMNDTGVTSMLAPATEAVLMMAAQTSFRDRTALPDIVPIKKDEESDLQYSQRWNSSVVGRSVERFSRPARFYRDMWRALTYEDNPAKGNDLYRQVWSIDENMKRYKLGREGLGIDNLIRGVLGKGPYSRGGMLDARTGTPGVFVIPQKPYGNAAFGTGQAEDYVESRQKDLLQQSRPK